MTRVILFDSFIDPDIYFAVTNLPDPFTIDIPIGITNNETITLYFQATLVNPPTGWGNYPQNLGGVGAGASGYFTFSPTRSQPTLTNGEFTEQITIRINAYTDSGYTNLYGYQDLLSNITFIDYLDPTWTLLYNDNFDDGTNQNWVPVSGNIDSKYTNYGGSGSVFSTRYISAPYSLEFSGGSTGRHLQKSFSIGAYTKAFIIIHVYKDLGYIAIAIGNTLVKPFAINEPNKTWMRYVFPLTTNATNVVKLASTTNALGGALIDDIYIVAK